MYECMFPAQAQQQQAANKIRGDQQPLNSMQIKVIQVTSASLKPAVLAEGICQLAIGTVIDWQSLAACEKV